MRPLTGRDQPVIEYLAGQDSVRTMIAALAEFLTPRIEEFAQANRSYLTIAVGCTGGQHRSVYIAERLAEHFRNELPAGPHTARLAAQGLIPRARNARISSARARAIPR